MKEELKNLSEEILEELAEDLKDEANSIETVRENLKITEKGKPRQTIENCLYVLQHDPILAGSICRNELTVRTEVTRKLPWKRRGELFTDTDESNVKLYLEKNYQLTSERIIRTALDIFSNENSFHPIRQCLESLHWDGENRIRHALSHFLGAEENDYVEQVMQMHMLAAIERIYHPGAKYDICLCLVGPQGGGKSTFFRFLAIEDKWFTDDLKNLDDKNVFRQLQGHWFVEMAEMSATVNAKSVEEMKAFISRQKETYKIPYERHPEDRPRQCVFCGTSNDMHFLPFDRSGNRRFAPVKIDPQKAEVHILDNEQESRNYILQMWAEAMAIYRRGDICLTFSKEMEEFATQMQKDFMPEDTDLGMVELYLEEHNLQRTCIKQIYCDVFKHPVFDNVPIFQSKRIADILRTLGWADVGSRKFREFGSQKAWEPILKQEDDPLQGFHQIAFDEEIPFNT